MQSRDRAVDVLFAKRANFTGAYRCLYRKENDQRHTLLCACKDHILRVVAPVKGDADTLNLVLTDAAVTVRLCLSAMQPACRRRGRPG